MTAKHKHSWFPSHEFVTAVYGLKPNAAGVKEITVHAKAMICSNEYCMARAVISPFTGMAVEIEAQPL